MAFTVGNIDRVRSALATELVFHRRALRIARAEERVAHAEFSAAYDGAFWASNRPRTSTEISDRMARQRSTEKAWAVAREQVFASRSAIESLRNVAKAVREAF